MKVFLTGASGILGTDIFSQLQNQNNEVLGFNSKEIDITDLSVVKRKVADFKPGIIIHSAAMTDVDGCEDDKDAAFLANVTGSFNLSLAASEHNIPIVYISSCGVYGNGKTFPYVESDKTEPVNYHHYTKLEGENQVKAHNPLHLIIRPGWLFGGTQNHKKNFVEARRKEAISNSVLKSAADKFGSPSYTFDVAEQIASLIKAGVYGTFNVANSGMASRFDYVSEIIRAFNFTNIIEPVNSASFPRKANMPNNEMLQNQHLDRLNLNQMRSWQDALAEYISSTY